MVTSNTKLNTTIPGMFGYKKQQSFDKIKTATETYEKFGWLLKG